MYSFFFFNDTATTEIYTLSLHDALPISDERAELGRDQPGGAAARRGQARSRRPQGPAHGGGRGHEGQGADRRLRHLRSEEHTSELQSRLHLVCRLLLEKKKKEEPEDGTH